MDSCPIADDGQQAPTYLLSIAGVVFASQLVITLLSWRRNAASRRAKNARSDAAAVAAVRGGKGKAKTYTEYTMEAVHSHCTAEDAWVVIGDGVYDGRYQMGAVPPGRGEKHR